MSLITIFTPTYNRGYILEKLYLSLCSQSCKNFEWLIVDDGSTDNTKEIVENWINAGGIDIRFYSKKNGGKHTAINLGVEKARGELFFIVDSDDHLSNDAVKLISEAYSHISGDDSFAGVSGIRINPLGQRIGGTFPSPYIDSNALDIRIKHHIDGDLAEIYKTKVLREYPFPVFKGERFLTEAIIWNRIALKYKLRYTDLPIYICEYLEDGLTAQMTKLRHKNPKGATYYYAEYTRLPITWIQKAKGAINYWRFSFSYKETSMINKIRNIGLKWLILYPLGYMMMRQDKRLL